MKLISVIVPVYNVEKYIRRCIESIQNQTYRNLQIILVDDGSTDNSGRICDDCQKKDQRIKVIHQKNGGSVSARKAGLKLAAGAYIGFVDSDDYIEADMYEKMYQEIKKSKADFIQSGSIVDGKEIYGYEDEMIDFSRQDRIEVIKRNIFERQNISFNLWSKLFKAEIIKEAFFQIPNEQCFGEDLLCLCHYILKCNRICLYKAAFYHYEIREDSLSHMDWEIACAEQSKLNECIKKILRDNGLLKGCERSVSNHYIKCMLHIIEEGLGKEYHIERYRFSEPEVLSGKNLVLYGAGKVGSDYYSQISKYRNCRIVAWIDENNSESSEMIPIEKPEILRNLEYDTMLIAVKKEALAEEIKEKLLRKGLCDHDSSVIWKEPVCLW